MKSAKTWVWKVGRIVLAAVLLIWVFRQNIRLSDTVTLADGTEVYGTITETSDSEVRIDVDGRVTTFAVKDLRIVKGEPAIDRGLVTLLRRMTPREYVTGMLLLGIVPVVASVRWQMLLGAQRIRIGFWQSLRLTVIGLFFNNFMPGLTGGDVVKAYYAARLTEDRKTHAVVTVFLDRIIGMVALGLVAGLAIIVGIVSAHASSEREFVEAGWFIAGFVVLTVGGGICFYSRRLRRLLLSLARAVPGYTKLRETAFANKAVDVVKKVDGALFLYRYEKMVLLNTTAISFVAHSSAILSIYYFGRSLGITQAGFLDYFVVVPVGFIISSIPVTPAGWGVGEAVFKFLFGAVGVPGAAAVTMSVIYRLGQAIWTLPGGVMFMFQRDRVTTAEVEAEEEKLEEAIPEAPDGAEGS